MNIDKLSREIDERVDRRVKQLAIEVYNDASMNTPVDTGRLRGSWRISVGDMDDIEDYSTGQPVDNFDVSATLLNNNDPYSVIYVYNVANYAIYVERDNNMLANAVFTAINK